MSIILTNSQGLVTDEAHEARGEWFKNYRELSAASITAALTFDFTSLDLTPVLGGEPPRYRVEVVDLTNEQATIVASARTEWTGRNRYAVACGAHAQPWEFVRLVEVTGFDGQYRVVLSNETEVLEALRQWSARRAKGHQPLWRRLQGLVLEWWVVLGTVAIALAMLGWGLLGRGV